jgi:hypothetical protein
MKCSAPIRPSSLRWRTGESPELSCQRQAVTDGLCSQHARVERARRQIEHDRLLADHRRIVQRIMEIPPRD